jgi:hypothetical protein
MGPHSGHYRGSQYWGVLMRILAFVSLCLAQAFCLLASAQTNEEALRAMEAMRLSVKLGDSAELNLTKRTQGKADASSFIMAAAYKVTKVDQPAGTAAPTGCELDLEVKSFRMEGMQEQVISGEALRAVFPPLRLRTDGALTPIDVLNWDEVEREHRAIQTKMLADKSNDALAITAVSLIYERKEAVLRLFDPLWQMQRTGWTSRDGGFDVSGQIAQSTDLIGAQAALVPTQKRIIPVETGNGKVRATTSTTYDTKGLEAEMVKSLIGQLAGKKGAWNLVMSSSGEVVYDLQSGWLERMTETVTVDMNLPPETSSRRAHVIEVTQERTK